MVFFKASSWPVDVIPGNILREIIKLHHEVVQKI